MFFQERPVNRVASMMNPPVMIICRKFMTIYKQLDNIYLEVETEGGGARWKKNGHLDNWVKESVELINFIIKVTQI